MERYFAGEEFIYEEVSTALRTQWYGLSDRSCISWIRCS